MRCYGRSCRRRFGFGWKRKWLKQLSGVAAVGRMAGGLLVVCAFGSSILGRVVNFTIVIDFNFEYCDQYF